MCRGAVWGKLIVNTRGTTRVNLGVRQWNPRHVQLIPETVVDELAMDAFPRPGGDGAYNLDMLHHPVAGKCLRNYVVLSEFPNKLSGYDFSQVTVFWTRYYWLRRFALVWNAVSRYDAGLEQQLFQLLASAPDGLDAAIEIEAFATQAAQQQLKSLGYRLPDYE